MPSENFHEIENDEALDLAKKLAQETVMTPFELLKKKETKAVYLKIPFGNGDKIENAWVRFKSVSGDGFICSLDNDLEYSATPKAGDEVLVGADQIVDWICPIDSMGGKQAGNFTLRAFWGKLPEQERNKSGSRLAPSPHDEVLGFTFYTESKTPAIPYGTVVLAIIGGLAVLGYWLLKNEIIF